MPYAKRSCQRKCEVPGFTGLSYGVFYRERPPEELKRGPDRIFGPLNMREKRAAFLKEVVKNANTATVAGEMYRHGRLKVLEKGAARDFDVVMQKYMDDLERRRDELRSVIDAEEDNYIAEVEAQQESPNERHQRLVARLQEIKRRRAEEQAEIARQKYEQKFRLENEDVRGLVSAKCAAAVMDDRKEQLREQAALKELERTQNRFYDQLWHEDYLSKVERDRLDAAEQHTRNMEQLEILQNQIAAKEGTQALVQQLKEDDRRLCEEQKMLLDRQTKFELEQKRLQQERTKRDLTEAVNYLKSRRDYELNAQRTYENLLLQTTQDAIQRDKELAIKRKCDEAHDTKEFLKFLSKEKEAMLAGVRERAEYIENESERLWQNRADVQRQAVEKRKQQLQETLEARTQQIREKELERLRELDELRRQEGELLKNLPGNKYYGIDTTEEKKMLRDKAKMDVKEQIEFNAGRRSTEKAELVREYERCKQKEEEYQEKLKELLKSAPFGNIHPMRVASKGQRPAMYTDTVEGMERQTRAISALLRERVPDPPHVMKPCPLKKEYNKLDRMDNCAPVINRFLHFHSPDEKQLCNECT